MLSSARRGGQHAHAVAPADRVVELFIAALLMGIRAEDEGRKNGARNMRHERWPIGVIAAPSACEQRRLPGWVWPSARCAAGLASRQAVIRVTLIAFPPARSAASSSKADDAGVVEGDGARAPLGVPKGLRRESARGRVQVAPGFVGRRGRCSQVDAGSESRQKATFAQP